MLCLACALDLAACSDTAGAPGERGDASRRATGMGAAGAGLENGARGSSSGGPSQKDGSSPIDGAATSYSGEVDLIDSFFFSIGSFNAYFDDPAHEPAQA